MTSHKLTSRSYFFQTFSYFRMFYWNHFLKWVSLNWTKLWYQLSAEDNKDTMGPNWPSGMNKHPQLALLVPGSAVVYSACVFYPAAIRLECFVIDPPVPHIPGGGSSNRQTHRSLSLGLMSAPAGKCKCLPLYFLDCSSRIWSKN